MTQKQLEEREAQQKMLAAETEASMQDDSETLDPTTLTCEYLDETFFKNKGVVVNFLNSNCPGATNLIGGFRLALSDVRKMPAYLSKHKDKIRAYAVKSLDRHILDNLCSTGAGDTLSSGDYGISFTVASVTEKGAQLNPSGRHEGPLYYCSMPGLLEPVSVGFNEDDSLDQAHIINAYIHLLPAVQRRPQVLRRLGEEKIVTTSLGNSPRNNGTTRGGYEGGYKNVHPYTSRYYEDLRPRPTRQYQAAQVHHDLILVAPAVQPVFPPLPSTPAPVWKRDGSIDMPADL